MKRKRSTTSSTPTKSDRRRQPRRRGVPRWLTGRKDLDQVAQRRCLLVLSVLSGQTSVTAAITEHGISRPLYYQLETKAVLAMLKALAPGAGSASSPEDASPMQQIVSLEDKVTKLEQEKRRLERLLLLTKKVLPAGPIAFPQKRGRRPGRKSASAGVAPSSAPKKVTTVLPIPSSTPTTAGATMP